MASDKRKAYNELAAVFAGEDKAREYLEQKRWGAEGPYCPHCGHVGAYKITPKAGSKTRKGVYKCAACREQFTVTVGTVFESSRIPLNKWLHAIHLMCASKKGVSAKQLERHLGITYKSAWFLCHRIRKAMEVTGAQEKLTGIVEADETYVGGFAKGAGRHGPQSGGKTVVLSVVQRDGEVRSTKVPNAQAKSLRPFIRANVEGSARIMTDQHHSYRGFEKEFAEHGVVDHSRNEYVRGIVHTNTVEGVFSLLKRGIIGVYHQVSEQHMQRYLAEFDFRYNSRKITDLERVEKAIQASEGKRLMYRWPKGVGAAGA